MNFSALAKATLAFATFCHEGTVRKFTGDPYITHCIEVARLVQRVNGSEAMICAALLHDVVEDTPFGYDDIRLFYRSLRVPEATIDAILKLVEELTDVYTKEAYPELNREARKRREALRLWEVSPEAQTIKSADIINNTFDIVLNDPDFAVLYLKEKTFILMGMNKGNAFLYEAARRQTMFR